MSFDGLYDIRNYTPEDKNFIIATFLKGLYHGDSWFSLVPKPIFMQQYHVVAERMFDNPGITIKIACLPEDPAVIIGYSVLSADGKAIVWVYVKSKWRNQGIGRSLTPSSILYATHVTKLGRELLIKNNIMFNPFY